MELAAAKNKSTGNTIYTHVPSFNALLVSVRGIDETIEEFQNQSGLGLPIESFAMNTVLTLLSEMSYQLAIAKGDISGSRDNYILEAKAFFEPMIQEHL